MGAWGPGIFSDDTAVDIRSDYRELLEDQVLDDQATRRIIDQYAHLDDDEAHVLWLALAAAQSQFGRLDDEIKAKALEVIDNGRGLHLWEEAGAKELTRRKAALNKLRDRLMGPQPARKALRRPWRHFTDVRAGDVFSFTAQSGQMALLRVTRIDDHRLGVAPILERLDWRGKSLPAESRLRGLKVRRSLRPALGGPMRPETYRVSRDRKRDQDWSDCGFLKVASLPPRPEDEASRASILTDWTRLARKLDDPLAGKRTDR